MQKRLHMTIVMFCNHASDADEECQIVKLHLASGGLPIETLGPPQGRGANSVARD